MKFAHFHTNLKAPCIPGDCCWRCDLTETERAETEATITILALQLKQIT